MMKNVLCQRQRLWRHKLMTLGGEISPLCFIGNNMTKKNNARELKKFLQGFDTGGKGELRTFEKKLYDIQDTIEMALNSEDNKTLSELQLEQKMIICKMKKLDSDDLPNDLEWRPRYD